MKPLLIPLACLVLLSGCTARPTAVMSVLYLGHDKPVGTVSEAEIADFLDREVATVFPDGFTVIAARGHWRNPAGEPVREETTVIEILHPDQPGSAAAIARICAAYKQQFQQQAVLHAQWSAEMSVR